jgi:UPF0755 protein
VKIKRKYLWRGLAVSAAFALVLAISAHIFLEQYFHNPGPLTKETTLIVERGSSFHKIAHTLEQNQVIERPRLLAYIASNSQLADKIKAGEYQFAPSISPKDVLNQLIKGPNVLHKITIPEGLNVREILTLIEKEPKLKGPIPSDIKEGSLLPETYHFHRGDTRESLVKHMQEAMNGVLLSLWAERNRETPLKNTTETLILASIVEKETGVDGERAKVAAVFINRLKRRMRLQSDPTAIYGIELETGKPLGRKPRSIDMKHVNPFNTYLIDRLPPTPICNPGMAAIEAVLNPADIKDLYFVADGKGGHNFARNLRDHNRNVAKYRRELRKK